MAAAMVVGGGGKDRSSPGGGGAPQVDTGKYVRYTPEQVEALERVYSECPKPSSLRRQQLIRECPILSNIEPKQIKVWFQNRRCVAGAPAPLPIRHLCSCLPAFFFSFSGIVRPCRQNSPPFLYFLPSWFGLNFKSVTNFLVSRVCLFSCRPSKSSWVQREEGKKWFWY
jgi:hypothetical protein